MCAVQMKWLESRTSDFIFNMHAYGREAAVSSSRIFAQSYELVYAKFFHIFYVPKKSNVLI